MLFFFQAEDGIRDLVRSRGLGDVYKRQRLGDERSEMVNSRLSEVIVKCAGDIQSGVIISVSDRTIRIRRLPI